MVGFVENVILVVTRGGQTVSHDPHKVENTVQFRAPLLQTAPGRKARGFLFVDIVV